MPDDYKKVANDNNVTVSGVIIIVVSFLNDHLSPESPRQVDGEFLNRTRSAVTTFKPGLWTYVATSPTVRVGDEFPVLIEPPYVRA